MLFGIGMSEMLVILGIALLVFGPQKLPEIAKQIAKGLRDLRRASDDLRRSVSFDDEPPARPRTPLPARVPGSELTAENGPPPDEGADAPPATPDLMPVAAPGTEPRGDAGPREASSNGTPTPATAAHQPAPESPEATKDA